MFTKPTHQEGRTLNVVNDNLEIKNGALLSRHRHVLLLQCHVGYRRWMLQSAATVMVI